MTYCTFLEGEQAEAYKRRKAAEKEFTPSKRYSANRKNTRYMGQYGGSNRTYNNDKKNYEVEAKTARKLRNDKGKNSYTNQMKDLYNKVEKGEYNMGDIESSREGERMSRVADATMRHYRRHPHAESAGIFGNIDII